MKEMICDDLELYREMRINMGRASWSGTWLIWSVDVEESSDEQWTCCVRFYRLPRRFRRHYRKWTVRMYVLLLWFWLKQWWDKNLRLVRC